MNTLDLILSIPLFLGLFNGFRKGLISQVTGLVSVLILLVFGGAITTYLKKFLIENQVVEETWGSLVAYFFTGILVFLSLALIAKLLRGIFRSVGLGFLEKLGGAGLGLIKVFFILVLIFYFFLPINSKLKIVPEKSLNESFVLDLVKIGVDKVHNFWVYQL